ncbi:MAG: formylmethanofuran dehydrogenase subunit B [Methylobacillus sp.]|jgi:formylmethanofuran dehydrogenase subunit B|nr:formylmethanofuran dehydrogenase subunit B [Methylobacillus sp.]
MDNFSQAATVVSVTCPCCGLLCDDLTVQRDSAGQLTVKENGCARAVAFFARAVAASEPRIAGKPATLQEAITKAARILGDAKQPLIAGLGTDVDGMRAVMNLAETNRTTLDHMNSNALFRNMLVLQNSGWFNTTLTEVRNRVDLLLVVGTDVVSVNPRFFEREIWNKETLYNQDTAKREIVYLGGRGLDTSTGIAPDGRKPDVIECDMDRLPEVVGALRAFVLGKPLIANEIAGVPAATLQNLAQRLLAAKYSIVTWAAGALALPHAELTVQHLAALVIALNKTTRSAGLPLGGSDGDTSANQVSAWISGYPVRNSYMRNIPDYDPWLYSAERQLQNGEADALLWISSFSPERVPPATDAPTVVFGEAHMKFDKEPDVFIPVATPGVDCKGTMFRIDNVVSLPLQKLRDSKLPALAEVLRAIEQQLGQEQGAAIC